VIVIIGILFPWYFFLIILVTIAAYIIDTFVFTEWTAKYFKNQNIKDQNYNQKVTDALLNFETVKYFNAEQHEEDRYMKALLDYKKENVKVSYSLVTLNLSQALIIVICMSAILTLTLYSIRNGTL